MFGWMDSIGWFQIIRQSDYKVKLPLLSAENEQVDGYEHNREEYSPTENAHDPIENVNSYKEGECEEYCTRNTPFPAVIDVNEQCGDQRYN